MVSTSVTRAQTNLPRLIREADEGAIAITRHQETVAYLVSRGRMDAIIETLDLARESSGDEGTARLRAGKNEGLAALGVEGRSRMFAQLLKKHLLEGEKP
jgi:PHD/YefM family antitoxin component YafN of YafNO toxin-antitoxin module